MATLKVKLRPSSVEGRAGTIYYQIIHNREVRQLKTEYKVSASEWNNASRTITTADIKSERISLLPSIPEGISRDLKRINGIIERFDKRHVQYLNFPRSPVSVFRLLKKYPMTLLS